jgi:hypothetical protein
LEARLNNGLREALAAMLVFAEATQRQYVQNLELFHTPSGPLTDPLTKTTPYAAEALAAAQTYTEKGEEYFVVLARLEGAEVAFTETEALVWLGNDAATFDLGVRAKPLRSDPRLQAIVQLHGERAVARAIYLRALLGGYVRAFDAGLFKRLVDGEPNAGEVAVTLVKQSIQEFEQSFGEFVRTVAFQQELVAYGQSMEFPLAPFAMGRKLEDKDLMNGALLPPDIARQLREHFARNREARQQS